MQLNIGAAFPWIAAAVVILALYVIVRSKRVTDSRSKGRK